MQKANSKPVIQMQNTHTKYSKDVMGYDAYYGRLKMLI